MSAECQSCGAPIFWALTQAGKREPIDVEPVPEGNIEIVGQTTDRDPLVRHLKKGEAESPTLIEPPLRYVSHFATCPHAPEHRKAA